jgi:hypothetical protein
MAKYFIPFIIGILVTGAFLICLINFGLLYQGQNAPLSSSALNNDSGLVNYLTALKSDLSSGTTSLEEGTVNAVSNSSITTGSLGSPFLTTVGGTWKVIKTAPTAIYAITIGYAYDKLFYGSEGLIIYYFIGAIMALILFGAIIYLITRGEPG